MIIQSKKVWLADQFVPAAIEVNDGRITAILPYGTLTVDSLITVTRSCGIDTRFPFNVPAAARWGKVTERTCCFLFSSSKSIAQPYTKRKKKRRNA
jgi:hypothetical protein